MPRPVRGFRVLAAAQVAQGSGRRLARRPPAARRRRRGGPDPGAGGAADAAVYQGGMTGSPVYACRGSYRSRVRVEASAAGPVDRVHELLSGRLDLAQPYRLRRGADPDVMPTDVNAARFQGFRRLIVNADRPDFDPLVADECPCTGLRCEGSDPPLDDRRG